MQKWMRALALTLCLVTILVVSPGLVTSQVREPDLKYCVDLAFSTEEDFLSRDILISDGDLLGIVHDATGPQCGICARNGDLLANFDISDDIGLDAADVINADAFLVAFSTELDSPNNALPAIQFTAGDLLATNGTRIPNMALTYRFQVPYDIGLDALQTEHQAARTPGDRRILKSIIEARWRLMADDFEGADRLFSRPNTGL